MSLLTYYLDIAGRVVENDPYSSQITVAGIAVPNYKLTSIKSSIDKNLPKWKTASHKDVDEVFDILITNQLTCGVFQFCRTTKAGNAAWAKFWKDGRVFHNKMASYEKGKVGFVLPGGILKCHLFVAASAMLTGVTVKNCFPYLYNANGRKILSISWCFDTDIEGAENKEVFEERYRKWADTSKMRILGIEPIVDKFEFKTEQEEPMLLLADNLAGCFHWHRGIKGLSFSEAEIRTLRTKLISGLGKDYMIHDKREFAIEYHLEFQNKEIRLKNDPQRM